MTFW
jgi:hypothetical protein